MNSRLAVNKRKTWSPIAGHFDWRALNVFINSTRKHVDASFNCETWQTFSSRYFFRFLFAKYIKHVTIFPRQLTQNNPALMKSQSDDPTTLAGPGWWMRRRKAAEGEIWVFSRRVNNSHLPPKQHDGATLIAGSHLWFEVIDYPDHWGLQTVASGEQKVSWDETNLS